ncbi:MAG TPA: hypothetical protein VG228_06040 [Solirubrobacteraceae bacterium]|jgi:hypothetical protein|nr:hypothetical protein [Solirubrobacteraceae bacterium]
MPARLQLGVLSGFAALACILALAACGGSSKPKHSSHQSAFIAFSKCMRTHGITNFPDPSGGGGLNIAGTGINPQSPAFQAAQGTCFKLLPGGGPNSHKASEQQIRAATETAQCMRAHGVTGYPDPIISTKLPTNLNQANYSSISAGGGIIIAIPKSINTQSPAFVKAAKACQARGG